MFVMILPLKIIVSSMFLILVNTGVETEHKLLAILTSNLSPYYRVCMLFEKIYFVQPCLRRIFGNKRFLCICPLLNLSFTFENYIRTFSLVLQT